MKLNRRNRFLSLLGRFFTIPAMFLSMISASNAVVYYWDGATNVANNQSNNATTTAQNWVSGGNWDNGTTSATRLATAFTATDDVVFGGTAASQTVTAAALTVRNMTFGGGTDAAGTTGTAYTISGAVTITRAAASITTTNTNATISSVLAGTTWTKSGAGILTLSGVNTFTGVSTISAGTLRIGNATALGTTAGNTTISSGATVDLNGFTITEPFGTIAGTGVGANGALINSSGTAASISGTISTGGAFTIGAGNITLATVTASGTAPTVTKIGTGTLTFGGTADNNSIAINANAGTVVLAKSSSATVHAFGNASSIGNGGTMQLAGTGDFQIWGAANLTVNSGGVLDLNGRNQNWLSFGVTGSVNLNGTGISSGGAIINNTVTTSTLTLGSGSVVLQTASSIGGTGNIVITGGTGINGAISGTGTLAKIGAGTLTLNSTNTYSGATSIDGGTLAIGSAGAAASTDIVVKNATRLQVDSTGKTLKGVELQTGSSLTLPAVTSQTTNILNNLTLTSTPNFTVKPVFAAAPVAGTFDLLTPLGITGTEGTITTDMSQYAIAGSRVALGASTAITGGKLVLTVTAATGASLVWDNINGTGTGVWNNNVDSNFKNGAVDDQFYPGDIVSFTDTSAGAVTLAGTLSPTSILVNSTTNYSFDGAGVIGGTTGLTKSGSSTLTINTANSYTGVTTVNAGILVAGTSTAFGSASTASLLFSSGSTSTVRLNGNNVTLLALNTTDFSSSPIVENGAVGNSVLTVANTTANTFAGVLQDGSTGTLGLTKSGAGNLYLQGSFSNTLTGPVTIDVTGGTGTTGVPGTHGIYLGKSGGAVAIPTNVIFGTGAGGQGNLRMQANNQFGAGVVMTFNNANGQWCRFDLAGTNQVLKGLVGGSTLSTNQVGAVIQNRGLDLVSAGGSVLTLNAATAPEDYYYYGYLRDADSGALATNQLNIVKNGLGKQTFAGNQVTYTGTTTVNAGTLSLEDTTGFVSPTLVASGATITLNRKAAGLANRNRIGGLISGTGTIDINNAVSGITGGWVTFNGVANGLSNFNGTLNVNSGVLAMDNVAGAWVNSAPTVNVASGGFFGIRAQSNVTVSSLNGAGDVGNFHNSTQTLTVGSNNGSGNFSGIIHGNNTTTADGTIELGFVNLLKLGTGTQILSGINTYTGTTTVNEGVLALAGGSAIVDTNSITLANVASAALRLDSSETVGSITGGGVTGGNVNLQGNTLTLGGNNSSSSIAGAITGTGGAITKLGTGVLTLSGANTYTGTTTISAGSVVLSGTGTSNISLAATTAANITGSTTGSLTVADTAVVLGEGTVGSLNLGSATGATLNVNPTTPAALSVTGAASVTGVVTVNLTSAGFTPGVPFTVMTFGSNANGFDETNFQIANAGNFRSATFVVNPTDVTLEMGSLNLTWNNGDTPNAGKWDSSSTNFYDASAPGNEFAAWGDFLTFGDAIAPNGPGNVAQVISVIGAQQPASMTVSGATDYTFTLGAAGAINGGTSLTKSGSGTLTMNLPNGYTGGTTITGGVVNAGASGALGTGLVTLSNGTLNATVTNALGAANVALNGGTLIPGNVTTPFGTATIAFGGGTLQYLATGTTTDVSSNLKNSTSPIRVDTNGNAATFGTALPATNTAGLTKIGAGNLTLGVAQAYLGGTSIEAGSITVAANNFPTTGTVAVGAAGTAILSTAGTTFSNAFSGPGLIQLNLGSGGANNTYLSGVSTGFTGTIEVSGTGGNKLSHTAAAGQTLNISPLALIKVNAGAQFFQAASIANPIQLIGTGNTENRGALRTTIGTFSGSITLMGNTTIGHEGGILAGSISGGVASPIVLTLGTTNSTAGSNITGNITDGLASSLALTFVNGNNTLGGTNAFTGGITLTAGSLTINGTNANGAGITTVTAGTLNLNGTLAGTGALAINGTSVLNLSGSTAGPLTMNGTSVLNMSGSTGGTLTMAAGTTLTGEGSAANITTLGALNLTTNPSTAGALSTAGTLNIGGLTTVSLAGGALPGGAIKVLEFGTLGTGVIPTNFALANSASYRPGASFAVNANDVSVTLANATLEWNNAGSNLTWNTNTTANFRDTTTLANDRFFFGDHVIFGDLPGAAQTVTITGNQQVSSMSVNSQYNYTFTTGSITGGAALTKAGTGILTVNTANTFTSTLIRQGEMRSGNGSSAGTSGTITINDATTGAINTAFLATTAQTINNPIVVANQGTGLVRLGSVINTGGLITYNGTVGLNRATTLVGSGDRTTFTGKISGNVGTLTIDGSAGHRVTIGVGNDFVGDVVVNNGVIYQSDSPTSLPLATNMTLLGTSNYRLNNGGTHTINALNGTNPGSNVNIIAGGASTLSLGNNNGSGVFNGAVVNNTAALSLIKNGSGTQSLLGANNFTGTITINAGALELSPVATYGAITVADGAALGIVGSSTASLTTTALTLGATGSTTLNINNFGSSLTEAPLKVSGALTANGTITANVSGSFTVGTYPLISYASGSLGGAGFAAFTLGTLPNGTSATLVNNTANRSIDLVVTAAGSLTWDGTINSQWDLNTTANWLNPAPANYVNADVVLFNDAAAGSTNVVLNAAVTPASVTFNNTSKTYTLSGTGSIGGVAPIVKTGTGLTTLTTSNTSTGLVTISAGTLQLGDGTTNGSVAGNIANTANLIFNNATAQSYAGNITGFLGTVTKTGPGTLTLTGINTYTGGTTVSNGILQLGDGAQNGTVGTGTYSLAGGTTLFLNYANAITVNTWSFGITGAGTIRLNSAQPVNASANWGPNSAAATPLNPAFTGTVQVDRGRFDSSAVGLGGTTNVIIKNGAQFLGWTGTYSQPFSIEGDGWGEAGQFGSLRAAGGQLSVFNGNITLTNNASLNAQDTGTVMTINGVIGGTGNLTRYNSGRINFYGSGSNTWTGGLILDSTGATAAATTLVLGKTGGALAIPANTVITFGNGVSGESNLRMEQSNQFGSGVVINSVNPSGQWSRFDLRGTSQTLAGINTGTASVAGGGIVQNRATLDTTSEHGAATLTLNGSGSYLFNGLVRNVDSGTTGTNLLNLVKSGTGTQTFAGANILHTGTNTINGGTLVLPARSPSSPFGDTTVTTSGAKLAVTGAAGSTFNTSSLDFASGALLSVRNFANVTSLSTATINASNLSASGPVTVDISTMPNGTGPFPIITYSNGYSGNDFVLDASGWTLPRSITSPALVNDTVNGVINLTANYNPLIWVGTSNIWDLITQNWTLAGNPADYDENDVVQFDESGTVTNPDVVLNTAITPNVVNFMNATNPYSLAGTGGIGGTTAINKTNTGTVVIKNANPTTGLTTITQGILQLGDGTLNGSVGGSIALAGATVSDATLVLNPGATQTHANVISGTASSGTVSKIGTGTTILTGVSTYAGATTINGGTLQLGDGTIQPTIPSTYAITSPGTLKIQYNTATGAVAQTWSKYTGNGTLTLATGKNFDTGFGNGALTNSFTGNLRIEGGRVALSAATGAATNYGLGAATKITIGNGGHLGMWEGGITLPNTMAFEIAGTGYGEVAYEVAIRMANSGVTTTINGPMLLTATASIGSQGTGVGAINGVISGSAGANLVIGATLTGWQEGIIALGGANTYEGNTVINMGTLRLAAAGVIPDGVGKGNVNLAAVSTSATLNLNGFSETINGLSGAGTITAGSGTPTLTVGNNDQTSTYSGTINGTGTLALTKIGSGTLTLSGPLAGSPAVPTSNSAFTGNITVSAGKLIGAAVRTGSNTVFGAASNTRTITVESGATLEFHATNTFGGHNTITVPTLVVNGGTVTNADPLATNRINNGLRNVTLNDGTLLATVGNGTSDIDAVNRPGEGYGAWGFNGTVTSTGTSLISTGSLTGKAGRILLSSNTADTNFNVTSGTLTVAAPLQTGESTPSYGMTKTGAGTLVLSAVNVHSTPTIVSAGTLHLTGSMIKPSPLIAASAITVGSTGTLTGTGTAEGTLTVQAGGFVNPGTAGTTGTLNVGASTLSGTYTCDINGASADRINVTGALTASGTPSLVFNTVSAPTLPSYTIATYSTGSAPVIPTITGVPAGYVVDTATVGEIKLVAVPYLAWAGGKGLTAGNNGLTMDPENDGINNLQEYYFDGNPLANDPSVLPQSSLDANYLILTFKRRDDAEADVISQFAQWGSTLTGWTNATITAATAAADANGVIITVGENGAAADDVEVKIPRANAVNGRLFGRVLITE